MLHPSNLFLTLSTFPVLTGEGERWRRRQAPASGDGLGLRAERNGVVLLCLVVGLDGKAPPAEAVVGEEEEAADEKGSEFFRSNFVRAWLTEPVLAAEKRPRRMVLPLGAVVMAVGEGAAGASLSCLLPLLLLLTVFWI